MHEHGCPGIEGDKLLFGEKTLNKVDPIVQPDLLRQSLQAEGNRLSARSDD